MAKLSRMTKSDGTTRKARLTYIHTDHLATPRSASDEDGNIVWTWESDAFGSNALGGGIESDP